MCPDEELLSAYADGEVPSPWDSRIAAHAAECPDCARRLRGIGALSSALKDSDESPLLMAAKERVRARLDAALAAYPGSGAARVPIAYGRQAYASPFWRKRVSVPLPLALAAALLVGLVPTVGLLSRAAGAPALAASKSERAADSAPAGSAPAAPAAPAGESALAASQASAAQDPMTGLAATSPESFSDMGALIRYLDSVDSSVKITVELPANRSFGLGGPAEIRKVSTKGAGK